MGRRVAVYAAGADPAVEQPLAMVTRVHTQLHRRLRRGGPRPWEHPLQRTLHDALYDPDVVAVLPDGEELRGPAEEYLVFDRLPDGREAARPRRRLDDVAWAVLVVAALGKHGLQGAPLGFPAPRPGRPAIRVAPYRIGRRGR